MHFKQSFLDYRFNNLIKKIMSEKTPDKLTIIERFKICMTAQKIKYKEKGIGILISLFVFSLYFTALPYFLVSIWPYLQTKMSDKFLMGFSIIFVNVTVLLFYNFFMYFIYTLKIPFFQRYRINPNLKWPWQSNYQLWKKLLKKSILLVIFNQFVVGPLVLIIQLYFGKACNMNFQNTPFIGEYIWQFLFFLIMEDIGFYFAHSSLHSSYLYGIHKVHHQYTNSVAITAYYSHPLEFLFVAVPAVLGFKILSLFISVHIFSLLIWLTFRAVDSCDSHCGYEWSWSQSSVLPLATGYEYHNFHHSKNVGNFGSFFKLWDCLLGTNLHFLNLLKLRNQKLKKKE